MPVLETFLMSCKELRALLKGEIRAGYVSEATRDSSRVFRP